MFTLDLKFEGARVQVSWCPGHEFNDAHDALAQADMGDDEGYYVALMEFRDGLESIHGRERMPDVFRVRSDLSKTRFTLKNKGAWGRVTLR